MVVNEFFLNGAIESLHVGIHPWRLRVRMLVDLVQPSELGVKVFDELRAIIG